MKLLVWQWGRRGAGPRFAVGLAEGMRALPGIAVLLSLSAQAEILCIAEPPRCELPFHTYDGWAGFAVRALQAPLLLGPLVRWLRRERPDAAICAMPAALDSIMAAALRRARVPYLVVVHDADTHPGDGMPLQMTLQRRVVRKANGLVALTGHVAERLRQQRLVGDKPLLRASLPPFVFGPPPAPPGAHGGPLRLLSFGRLLPYKGLDLLADGLRLLGAHPGLEVRVVGSGPPSAALAQLARLPGVRVENRWVPEAEVGPLLAWADAIVLSHREASQSGVASAAIAAGRWIVATRVGGLAEQLGDESLARLCDPTPQSLAAAIAALVADPPPVAAPRDPLGDWRVLGAGLVRDIAALKLFPAGPA